MGDNTTDSDLVQYLKTKDALNEELRKKLEQTSKFLMIGTALNGINLIFPTPNSDLNNNTLSMSNIRSGLESAALQSGNPWAMAAGAAYSLIDKTGGMSDASEGLGGLNDTLNSISSIILPGAGYFIGKTDDYTTSGKMNAMSSGYGGAMLTSSKAEKNSGAKLLFGDANSIINNAKNLDKTISNIYDNTNDDYLQMASTTLSRAMASQYAKLGGYNQMLARAGKLGMKFKLMQIQQNNKEIYTELEEYPQEEIYSMKNGGEFNFEEKFIPTTEELNLEFFNNLNFEETPKFQGGGEVKSKTIDINELKSLTDTYDKFKQYLHENGGRDKEKDFDLKEFYYDLFTFQDEDGDIVTPFLKWLKTESLNKGEGHMLGRYKKPTHMTYEGENGEYWTLDENGIWIYTVPEDHLKQHTIDEYKDYWDKWEPNSILKYGDQTYSKNGIHLHKQGGLMNVIPEGNLHARLHHMENADYLTKKGIPVVDKEGNLLAEIELNEIIFNLDTTKKLEELYKKFKSDDTKPRDKDLAAIEAGEIVALLIMENTDDRTGLIDSIV